MMFLFLFLIFAIVAAALWFQGLWSAAVTLVNLLLAMMIATNFFEPIASAIEGIGRRFVHVLARFRRAVAAVRFVVRDSCGRSPIRSPRRGSSSSMPVEMAGRSILAAWCAWLMVCFVAFSLQMAPLNSPTRWGRSPRPRPKPSSSLRSDCGWVSCTAVRGGHSPGPFQRPDAPSVRPGAECRGV